MNALQLVTSLAAAFAFSLFFFCKLKKRAPTSRLPQPPEPVGAWPIIGHLHIVSRSALLHRTLAALADECGPILSLRLGSRHLVVVSSMQLARECFTTNDRSLAGRPDLLSTRLICYNGTMFALTPYGTLWRELRKITILELLSNHRIEMFKNIRVEEINLLTRGLHRRSVDDREPVELNRLLFRFTMNIITRMVTGKRFSNLDAPLGDEGEQFFRIIEEGFYLLGLFTVSDAFPWLEWLDVGGHVKAMKRVHKKLDGLGAKWVAEHRQRRKSGNVDDLSGKDFIDALISQVEGNRQLEGRDADTLIKATAVDVMLAGSDTSSDTLVWAISLLLNNRHMLKRAQDELDIHVGRERQVEESDVANLAYLQAIVKETMRLYPVVPLLVAHESIEPVNIGSYHVPVGTMVYVNAWKIHRDPELWPEPEAFRPERHLTATDKAVVGQSFEFMPFGSGRRSCPGSSLATRVVHITLSRLLQGFYLSTPGDCRVDMTEGFGMTMPKLSPLHVFLKPRLAPHLYG